jgi:hypothetical protein
MIIENRDFQGAILQFLVVLYFVTRCVTAFRELDLNCEVPH